MTVLVGLGWFAAFLRALAPTVGAEDSGEFAVVAASLGISHAPGYPLYALVGRLALLVPAGDPAFRLNLLSAASASAACAALFGMVRSEAAHRFGCGRPAAVLAGLAASAAFGLGRALWHQATISDKYAFHLMLHAGICLAAVRGLRPAAVALLAGVALSHHMQTLYLLPGLGWLGWRAGLRPRALALVVALEVIGVSPKLVYPPIRAGWQPAAMAALPVTLAKHASYLRAGTYTRRMTGPGGGSRWRDAFRRTLEEASVPGVVAAPVGLALWSWRAAGLAPFAWMAIGTGLVLSASLEITGREFYLLPVIWWLAAGTGWLLARGLAGPLRWRAGAGAGVVVVVGGLIAGNREWYDRSRMTLERDYGLNILTGLPPRTALFASGDDVLFPIFYLQSVLAIRPDVVVIPVGFLSWIPGRERIGRALPEAASLLAASPDTATEEGWSRLVAAVCLAAGRPVATNNPSRLELAAGRHFEVRDAVWEVFSDRRAFPDRPSRWLATRGWHRSAAGLSDRQAWLIGLYAKFQRQCADRLANSGHPVAALPRFRLALANPFLPDRPGATNNYALALERTGNRTGALAAFRRALADPSAAAEVWINAGNLLLGMNQPREAREMYEGGLRRAAPGSVHAAYAGRQLARLPPGGAAGVP